MNRICAHITEAPLNCLEEALKSYGYDVVRTSREIIATNGPEFEDSYAYIHITDVGSNKKECIYYGIIEDKRNLFGRPSIFLVKIIAIAEQKYEEQKLQERKEELEKRKEESRRLETEDDRQWKKAKVTMIILAAVIVLSILAAVGFAYCT